jgi:lipopolysaccharide export system protein LptA
VVAAKAVFDHGRDEVTFTGGTTEGTGNARLWQGADSVSAPVLVLSRKQQTLTAHGNDGSTAVHAVFAAMQRLGDGSAKPAAQSRAAPTIVRVSSVSLLYSAAERKATFKGSVVAQQAGATVRTDMAEIYLEPGTSGNGGAGGNAGAGGASGVRGAVSGHAQASSIPNPQGSVDRMVAEGKVQFESGGRKGTGEKLVYTAADRKFVLTGTGAQPARIADPARGTVSGSSLIFNDRDDSVIVNGGLSRAVTETRISN